MDDGWDRQAVRSTGVLMQPGRLGRDQVRGDRQDIAGQLAAPGRQQGDDVALPGVLQTAHGDDVAEGRAGQILAAAWLRGGVVLGRCGVADGPLDGVAAGAGGFQLGGLGEWLADPPGCVGGTLAQVLDLGAEPSGAGSGSVSA